MCIRDSSQTAHCLQNDRHLTGKVIIFGRNKKGEVEIPCIVEYGTSTGKPAGKMPAILFQFLKAAFLPGILVFTDYNGTFVLPQIQNHLSGLYLSLIHICQSS